MLPVAWRKDFERMMEEVMTKAAIKAAPKILKRLCRRSEPKSLLDFNIKDALKPHDRRIGRRSVTSHQPWTDADKRRLHRLKRKGYSNDEIATKMSRSAGAIAQQWRKQSLN
ncbi:hypothetical protein F5X98DRAFT_339977 [Xylaria grammica]|nr:hypothetical protein F5X98DRAFT_339977 [Xylaria grammica]